MRVIHIIPYDGIGGVEIAARSLSAGDHGEIRFEKYFLVKIPGSKVQAFTSHGPPGSIDRLGVYFKAVFHILRAPPNLIIASLWRSVFVLILVKLFRPKQKSVVFLHLAHDVHFLDWLANRIGMMIANEIWADSATTLLQRVPDRFRRKGRVISFVLSHAPLQAPRKLLPEFIFWGRLSAQKDLLRALDIFAKVAKFYPSARFRIIGPDGGAESDLRKRTSELSLEHLVSFQGPMEHEMIVNFAKSACFYLQTSRTEGMAISVVEAMQARLVPIVTPVGEIARYCEHGENAILVKDTTQASRDIVALLEDPNTYERMACAAAKYWQGRTLFREDMISSCYDIMRLSK